jgi:hypothetical protein
MMDAAMLSRSAAAVLIAFMSFARADDLPRYVLRYDADARTMQVDLCLAAAARVRFATDGSAQRYLDAPTRDSESTLERDGRAWVARDWRAGECLHYRADLGRIADAQGRRGFATRGDALLTDPASWLLEADGAQAAEAEVVLPAGHAISAPWMPLPSRAGVQRFRIPHTPDAWMGRVAIGRFILQTIALDGGDLHVAILAGADDAQRTRLRAWLEQVGRAALSAYGRLPLADVQVLIVPVGAQRDAVVFGQSLRGQGNGLTLFVDPAQATDMFMHDWVAVHELSHLFHPHLGDAGAWLAEGLATYYQNVLRARAGLLTPEQAWKQLDAGFARGRAGTPARADLTLEQASTRMGERRDYQRVYWSGAAYWLDVDLELRRSSANRLGVDEALRRFAACCLADRRAWLPERFVAKLDELVGRDVFARRFRDYRALRGFPGITPMYARLGIRNDGDVLRFDKDGASADMREAIMVQNDAASVRTR